MAPIYPMLDPNDARSILVLDTHKGPLLHEIHVIPLAQAGPDLRAALARADRQRALEAQGHTLQAGSTEVWQTLPEHLARPLRLARTQADLLASWQGRTLRATDAAPHDPRTATAQPEASPVHATPSGQLPSNDEAAIPVVGPKPGVYWLSDEQLASGAVRLSQWASLDDLEAAGIVHKDMGLSEHRFHARIKAACRPEDQGCGWQVGAIVHAHLLKLRMQAAERGYRFEASGTGVAPRQNPEYEPHMKPQGSIPAWMPPGRTSSVAPEDERLAINACMDAIRHNIATVEATLRARKARRARELQGTA